MNKVIFNKFISEHTIYLRIERNKLQFSCGQCVSLGKKDVGVKREYSIYSGEQDDYLDFLIRVVEDGTISQTLSTLKTGDEVEVKGPFGTFLFDNQSHSKRNFFIASGTGIAPFRSFVRTYPDINCSIIHGVRQLGETYHSSEYSQYNYVSCVTGEAGGSFQGRIPEYLKTIDFHESDRFYICGNSAMINELFAILKDKKIKNAQISIESFF